LIGMTALPEARLAREAELSYSTIALVTDYDCWREDGDDVTVEKVTQILRKNADNSAELVKRVLLKLTDKTPSQETAHALKDAIFTDLRKVPQSTIDRLQPIIGRYVVNNR